MHQRTRSIVHVELLASTRDAAHDSYPGIKNAGAVASLEAIL